MAPRKVLWINPVESYLESVSPFFNERIELKKATYLEPPATMEKHASEADLIFIHWDGVNKRAQQVITSMAPYKSKVKAKIYAVTATAPKVDILNPKQSVNVGIAGWIELPTKYFEIQRLLFELDPESQGDDDADRPTAARDEAKGDFRKLKLAPEKSPDLRETTTIAQRVFDAPAPAPLEDPVPGTRIPGVPFDNVIAFHHDSANAQTFVRALKECAIKNATPVSRADEAMYLLRRKSFDLIILWYEATVGESYLLLKQIAETRELPWMPILVLIPGQSALQHLAQNYGYVPFDAVGIYDHKKASFVEALKKAAAAAKDMESAHSLLERLRAPLRPNATPELKSAMTLAEVERLTKLLAEKPGKRFWSVCETIPYLLQNKKTDEAKAALARLEKEFPVGYSTVLMRAVVNYYLGDKTSAPRTLVHEILTLPKLSTDRLYRIGVLLNRWKAYEALADLLDGWAGQQKLEVDHQAKFLAYRYYHGIGRPSLGEPFLAAAVKLDPMRAEYLQVLAQRLAEAKSFDRAADAMRLAIRAGITTLEARMAYVNYLIASRRIKEAREEIVPLIKSFPHSQEVLDLKAKLA